MGPGPSILEPALTRTIHTPPPTVPDLSQLTPEEIEWERNRWAWLTEPRTEAGPRPSIEEDATEFTLALGISTVDSTEINPPLDSDRTAALLAEAGFVTEAGASPRSADLLGEVDLLSQDGILLASPSVDDGRLGSVSFEVTTDDDEDRRNAIVVMRRLARGIGGTITVNEGYVLPLSGSDSTS